MQLNKVILVGRLTKNPELKKTNSGLNVTSFTIACDRRSGKENVTDFFTVNAWRSTAEFICKYFEKGSQILVEGELQTRSFESKDGKRTVVEVVASNVGFVDSKKDSSNKSVQNNVQGNSPSNTVEDFDETAFDEDIPF